MIQVYTGDGKGKTTAALGLAFRAAGHNLRVMMIQFMKGPDRTGELLAAEKLSPWLTIRPMGRTGFISKKTPSPEDMELAAKALALAREVMIAGQTDILILDEINVALDFGLLSLESVLELISAKPVAMELVLTGRHAHPAVLEKADLVTEMKNRKHYFSRGVPDREGIER
ncbi:MAG: cob(I)yrinic acid a,c-diamide adenosyltransferase [Thermodesulfobacteriota bacterium]